LAAFRNRELLSIKLKNFISVRIELAGGLDHQVNIFTPPNQRENTGVAPLSFPGNIEEPTTAMNTSSNLGGNPGLAHIHYASAGDSEGDNTDCVPPVLEQLSRALMNYQMSYLQRKLSNIWSAHLMDLGPAEQQYCLHSYISPAILCQTTLRDSGVIHLLNKLLNLLQIQGFAPLGFSQQYETQQYTPEKVFYVEGAWCCNFLSRVEATQRDLQDEWTSVEVRVCSASLLNTIRQTRLPTVFQTITSLDAHINSSRNRFRSRGVLRGLLGHFSSLQMERIERLFATVGETDPWGTVMGCGGSLALRQVD